MNLNPESKPLPRVRKTKPEKHRLVEQLREDVRQITEPETQAKFETASKALTGFAGDFADHEEKNESASFPSRTRPVAPAANESSPPTGPVFHPTTKT